MENFDSILIQFSLWLVKSCDGQMRGLAWNTICPNKNQIISQWPIWVWGTFAIRSIRLPHYNTQNNSSSLSTHPSQVQMIYGGDCQNLSHDLDPTNIKIGPDWFVPISTCTILEKIWILGLNCSGDRAQDLSLTLILYVLCSRSKLKAYLISVVFFQIGEDFIFMSYLVYLSDSDVSGRVIY